MAQREGVTSGLRSASDLSLVYAAAPGQSGSALRSGTMEGSADYFVFNFPGEKGFAIVAGDDRVRPVLGYSDKGSFDPRQTAGEPSRDVGLLPRPDHVGERQGHRGHPGHRRRVEPTDERHGAAGGRGKRCCWKRPTGAKANRITGKHRLLKVNIR